LRSKQSPADEGGLFKQFVWSINDTGSDSAVLAKQRGSDGDGCTATNLQPLLLFFQLLNIMMMISTLL
jgi:hypothetical protein